MLVQIQDRAALASLSIVSLRSYLNSRSWSNEGQWGSRPAIVYAKEHNGRNWEILVPTRDTVADYAENMAESIAILAAVEERSQLDVFYDLSAIGADVIRVYSVNGISKEPLSLRQSASLLKDSYDMLSAGARAAEKPQATYRGKMSSDVVEYLDRVRPLPGYYQGYALTLHSPVPVGFGRQEDLGDDFYAPFPRLATNKLAQGLEQTRLAAEQAAVNGDMEHFKRAVPHGVSANLCDSVAELAKKGRGIAIDLIWSGIRPSNIPNSHFQFSIDSAEILIEAAKSFRRNEPSYDEHILAHIVKLEKEPHEFDGRATIVSVWDGNLIRLDVEFEQQVYDTIISAFRDQLPVSLTGDIYPSGRRYELRNPRNLSSLPEERGNP